MDDNTVEIGVDDALTSVETDVNANASNLSDSALAVIPDSVDKQPSSSGRALKVTFTDKFWIGVANRLFLNRFPLREDERLIPNGEGFIFAWLVSSLVVACGAFVVVLVVTLLNFVLGSLGLHLGIAGSLSGLLVGGCTLLCIILGLMFGGIYARYEIPFRLTKAEKDGYIDIDYD